MKKLLYIFGLTLLLINNSLSQSDSKIEISKDHSTFGQFEINGVNLNDAIAATKMFFGRLSEDYLTALCPDDLRGYFDNNKYSTYKSYGAAFSSDLISFRRINDLNTDVSVLDLSIISNNQIRLNIMCKGGWSNKYKNNYNEDKFEVAIIISFYDNKVIFKPDNGKYSYKELSILLNTHLYKSKSFDEIFNKKGKPKFSKLTDFSVINEAISEIYNSYSTSFKDFIVKKRVLDKKLRTKKNTIDNELSKRQNRNLKIRIGHITPETKEFKDPYWTNIRSANFNATGSKIVTTSNDNTARIWDASSGELLHTLEGHTGDVMSANFNATGSKIVTVSVDWKAKIWDVKTGKLLHTLPRLRRRGGHITSAIFNPRGTQIVTTPFDCELCSNVVKIWDVKTGKLLHKLLPSASSVSSQLGAITAVCYNPAGSKIVTASQFSIKIWDAQSGILLHTLEGHTGRVSSAEYNATGSQILTASDDGPVRIWDAQSGKLLHTLEGHAEDVNSAVYNATGSQILTASDDGTARIWDAQSGILLHTLEGHTGRVNSAVYNATGSQIVTASGDGTARIWDAQSGKLLHTFMEFNGNNNRQAVFNAAGSQILYIEGDRCIVWEISTGELLHYF